MNVADLLFVFLVAILLIASFAVDRKTTRHALEVGFKNFKNILPLFIAIFFLIGLFEVFISPQLIQQIMGKGAEFLAILIGAVIGGVATGPPAAIYPVGQYLLSQQASIAAIATLITAFITVGTVTLPIEIKYFGKRFAFSRWSVTFVTSILVGVLMGLIL